MRGEVMELLGTGYLYIIATLSITYAGFAALIVIIRQIIGGGVSSFDVYLIRNVLMRSFIVATSAMMPPLLALFELSQSIIWRISSLIAALLMGLFTLTFRARRRAVTDIPMPMWALIIHVLQAFIVIFLLMIALRIFIEPAAGPFAFGVTALLLLSFITYLVQLEVMLRGHVKKRKRI
jgi:hypothetical protein